MATTIHATFDGQVLRPEQPLNLAPNTRVKLTIEPSQEGRTTRGSSFLDTALSLELHGPEDWSSNLDDYLYRGKPLDDDA